MSDANQFNQTPLEKIARVVSYDVNNILITRELTFSENVSVNYTANKVHVSVQPSTEQPIGLPSSGNFGTENIANLLETDTTANAFDKVSQVLEDLRPVGPPELGTFTTVSLVDTTYSAYAAVSPYTLYPIVQNNPNNKPVMLISGFSNGKKGVLDAIVKNSTSPSSIQGSRILTSGDDTGIYGNFLRIISETTVNAFYTSLVASVGDSLLSGTFTPSNTTIYSMQMQHSINGSTNTIQFYQDDAYTNTPIANNAQITSVSGSVAYVSGVPTYTGTGFSFTTEVTAVNCIKKFYNSSWVAQVSGIGIVTATASPTGIFRNEGSNPTLSITSSIISGVLFTNNLTVVMTVQNAASTQVSITATHPTNIIRIDTVSLSPTTSTFSPESNRNNSYIGQYPAPTIDPYNSGQSLTDNYELQCINGLYQYPPNVNYTTFNPSGPDYSSLLSDNTYRHYTQNLGTVTSASFIEFDILNPSNFSTEIIDSTIRLTVSVVGVIGWIDANAPYGGSGQPLIDGAPALDMSLSNAVHKRVTFGGNLPSGFVLIRISIQSSSTITFGGFSPLTWA